MKNKLIIIIILWAQTVSLIAEKIPTQPISCFFEHYTTENGLPQSTIMDIHQDHRGYIWIATWDGISRFDGHTFRNYKVTPGDAYPMSSNRIETLDEDANGHLWMKSYDGNAHCFDPRTETWIPLQTLDGYADFATQIEKIDIKPSGRVWLLTREKGCLCVRDSTFSVGIYTLESRQLKTNRIHAVFEDSDRRSWILTDNGLYLIKNRSMETISFLFEEKFNSYSQSFHTAIEIDGEIWFGASRGRIWRYQKASGRFEPLITPSQSAITGFWLLSENQIAMATSGDGFFIYDLKTAFFKSYNKIRNKALNSNEIQFIYFDTRQQLWFVTDKLGIYRLNLLNEEITWFPASTDDAGMASAPSPPLVIEDRHKRLWIHPRGGGFSIYNETSQRLDPFYNNAFSPDFRFSNICHTAFSDKQGNLWLSTHSGGLEKVIFGDNSFKILEINPESKLPSANDVRAVLQDGNNQIWVATKSCHLVIYDERFHLRGYLANDGTVGKKQTLANVQVYSMMQDRRGDIWLGTRHEGVFRLRKTANPNKYQIERFCKHNDAYSLSDDAIYSIFEDSRQNIWIGTYGGGLNLVETDSDGKVLFINHRNRLKGYPIATNHRIRCITENRQGNICIGTTAGMILFSNRFQSPETIPFKSYTRVPGDRESLSHNDIHGICNTRSGDMFIAAFGGGINKVTDWDSQGFPLRFKTFGTTEGLPLEVCLSLVEDRNGQLWVSMESALSRFDPQKETFETPSEIKRLMTQRRFSEASTACLKSGEILFGFSGGLVAFDPNEVKPSDFEPYIALSDFKLFNRPVGIGNRESPLVRDVDSAGRLVLKHNQNFFSIEFTALDFVFSDNILYAYQLEGFDRDWVYCRKQRVANYTNLPKGEYVFRVKSTNHEGVWVNNERQLAIEVLPSFWETPWAYILYLALFLALVFLTVYLSVIFYRLRSNVKIEKRMSEMKLRFFTNISHEIRTPLTMITAPVEALIAEADISDRVRKQLTLISQNTNRLLRLVNQIMDFRKIQQFKLTVEEIDLGAEIENLCSNFDELALQHQIHFRFVNRAPGETVWVDVDCLEKIVINLLSNAFKYTPDRRAIRVTVKSNERCLQLEVADEGRGIAKERQKNLFTRFMSYNDDKNKPSTGIGLFIVKDLVDKHGGKIEVESEINEGSIFTVSFLRGNAHFGKDVEKAVEKKKITDVHPVAVPDQTAPDLDGGKGKRRSILLVEDDTDLRAFLRSTLEEEYAVIESHDGTDGWERARKSLPDFIISDIMMPGLDGVELLQKLKEDSATSHIPVVLLTAKTTIESKLEGLAHGADDYITKPFNIPYLKARVRNLFEQRQRLQEAYRSRLTDIYPQSAAIEADDPFAIAPQDENLLRRAVQIVEAHIDDSEFSVDALVLALGMSRSVFFNKVKSLTGLAPIEFIRDLRLKRAAELLASGNYLVKEVSYMIGIADVKYFGKCFKAKFGMTPQDYKQS